MSKSNHFVATTSTGIGMTIDSLELDLLELGILKLMANYTMLFSTEEVTPAQKSTFVKLNQGIFQLKLYTPEELQVILTLFSALQIQIQNIKYASQLITASLNDNTG